MNKSLKSLITFFASAFFSIFITYFAAIFVISPVLEQISVLAGGCGLLLTAECVGTVPDPLVMLIIAVFMLFVFLATYKFLEKKIK